MNHNGGLFVPEMRLIPSIPGLIMMPFGLAGFGICVQHRTHWIGPVSMMAVTIFGYQQLVSLGMAYGIDCYKPQAPYVAAAIVFCRQLFGFTVNYWLLPWVEASGGLKCRTLSAISIANKDPRFPRLIYCARSCCPCFRLRTICSANDLGTEVEGSASSSRRVWHKSIERCCNRDGFEDR